MYNRFYMVCVPHCLQIVCNMFAAATNGSHVSRKHSRSMGADGRLLPGAFNSASGCKFLVAIDHGDGVASPGGLRQPNRSLLPSGCGLSIARPSWARAQGSHQATSLPGGAPTAGAPATVFRLLARTRKGRLGSPTSSPITYLPSTSSIPPPPP